MSPDVAAWLRSPEGERWSRERHDSSPVEINHDLETWWRATGPLAARYDPAGAPAIAISKSGESS